MKTKQMYAAPVPYFAENKQAALDDLEREAADLIATVDDPLTPWIERERAASRLKTVARELEDAERNKKAGLSARVARGEDKVLIPDDSGTSYLMLPSSEVRSVRNRRRGASTGFAPIKAPFATQSDAVARSRGVDHQAEAGTPRE